MFCSYPIKCFFLISVSYIFYSHATKNFKYKIFLRYKFVTIEKQYKPYNLFFKNVYARACMCGVLYVIYTYNVPLYTHITESITINYIVCIDSHKLEIISIMISLLKAENLLS